MFSALPTAKDGQLLCDYAKYQVRRQYQEQFLRESGSDMKAFAPRATSVGTYGDTEDFSAPIFNPHANLRKAIERDESSTKARDNSKQSGSSSKMAAVNSSQRQVPPSRGKRSNNKTSTSDRDDASSAASSSHLISGDDQSTAGFNVAPESKALPTVSIDNLTDDELADVTIGIWQVTTQIIRDAAQLRQWLFGGLPLGLHPADRSTPVSSPYGAQGVGIALAASPNMVKDAAFFRDKCELLAAMAGRCLDAIATLESEDSVHLFSFARDYYDVVKASTSETHKDKSKSEALTSLIDGVEVGIPSTSLLLFSGDAVRLSFAFFVEAAQSIRQFALTTSNLVRDLERANGAPVGHPSSAVGSPLLVPHASSQSNLVGMNSVNNQKNESETTTTTTATTHKVNDDESEHFSVTDAYLGLVKTAEAIYEHPFSFLDSTGCRHKLVQPEYLDALRSLISETENEVVRLEKIQSTLTENRRELDEARRQRDTQNLKGQNGTSISPPTRPPPPPAIIYDPPLEQFAYFLQVIRLYYISSLVEDELRTINFFVSTTTMLKVQLAHVQSLMNENRKEILTSVEKRHKTAMALRLHEEERLRAEAEAAGEPFQPNLTTSPSPAMKDEGKKGDILYQYYTEDEKKALQCTFMSFADLRNQLNDLKKRIEADIKKKNKTHGVAYTGGVINNSALGRGCVTFARPKDKASNKSVVGSLEAGCFGGGSIPTTTAPQMNTLSSNDRGISAATSSPLVAPGSKSSPSLASPTSPVGVEKADPQSWGGWLAALPGKALSTLFCAVDPAVVDAQKALNKKKEEKASSTSSQQSAQGKNRFVSPAVYQKEYFLSEVCDLLLVCDGMDKLLYAEYPTLYGRTWKQTVGAAMETAAGSMAKGAEYFSVVFGGPHYYSIGREERLGGRSPTRKRNVPKATE